MTKLADFRRLHEGPEVLILANCWDAGTARLTASLGARAVATSSAAVAWSHGFRDGDALPVERLIATVQAIARVVDVPVTVDVEGGYSEDPEAVADTVAAVVEAGAVGINLEDGRAPAELLAAKIARIKQRGIEVFVNARVDVFLAGLAPPDARVAESIARAARYRDAGADGIFVPYASATDDVRRLAGAIALPLNVLACPGLPSAGELAGLGVRRLSAGSAIAQSAWRTTIELTRAFLTEGRAEQVVERATSYAELNRLF